MGHGRRIELLIGWWQIYPSPMFIETANAIALSRVNSFSPWQDASVLGSILVRYLALPDNDRAPLEEIVGLVEQAIHEMFERSLDPDDLERLINTVDENENSLGSLFETDIATAIPQLIENIGENLDHVDSDSTLGEFATTIKKMAKRVGHDPNSVEIAKEAIQRRIQEVDEHSVGDSEMSVTGEYPRTFDRFDDQDLMSLFASLITDDN
ncbi:hypothetical protein EBB79_14985 [Parasedimentitalea marina]|uniref:Uncharacterized protein n=2 Tax=Parasedimentitalea marina TaxID=2483033 RepID=A0A3T0N4U2_9RHOB|nr:hypothetical protein EBB79_14985 [Parasedimentitalea marina]